MEEQQQQEQTFNNQTRDERSDKMLNNFDILKRDNAGMHVLWRLCKQRDRVINFLLIHIIYSEMNLGKSIKFSKDQCIQAVESYASNTRVFQVIETRKNTKNFWYYWLKCTTYGCNYDFNLSTRHEGGSIWAFVTMPQYFLPTLPPPPRSYNLRQKTQY